MENPARQRSNSNLAHNFAKLSLLSILLTSVITTIRHFYELGPGAFVLGLFIIAGPVILLLWFRNTRGVLPLLLYVLINAWIIIGFGIVDGFWNSTIKIYLSNFLFRDSRLFIRSPLGSFLFELTGVFAFIASMFASWYGYKFLKAVIANRQEWSTWGRGIKLSGGLAVVVLIAFGSYDSYKHTIIIPQSKVIKIGVIVPVDGPGKLLGTSFLKAVELAKEDLKNAKYSYQIVIENSGTSPEETELAIQRLIHKGHVQGIVGGISASGRIVKPYVTAAKIPHLCVCSIKTIGDGEYNFTNIPLAEDEAIQWVKEAKKRGVKTVAILNQEYPSIESHVKALKEEAAKTGIQVVYEKEFEGATKDFVGIIAEAKKTAPDIYFISAFSPALDFLGEQLKNAEVNNVASIVALSVSNKPELFDGDWYTDSYVNTAFKSRFEQKYPGIRFATHMMPYAYDSFNMMVQAFESEKDPADYIQNLTEYPGTAGLITKNPGEGNFRSTPVVWVIKNGKPELLYEKKLAKN